MDQVRALENEMLLRIKQQGLDIIPRILIVSLISKLYEVFQQFFLYKMLLHSLVLNVFPSFFVFRVCRLLDCSLMQWELLVDNVWRKSMDRSIVIFFEFPLEMRREWSGNGFLALKFGHT